MRVCINIIVVFSDRPHLIHSMWYYNYKNASFWKYLNIKSLANLKSRNINEQFCIIIKKGLLSVLEYYLLILLIYLVLVVECFLHFATGCI